MPPVIAIVGRPNVGKSTLFNRLTARRTALVSDMPGLTRDRREGEAVLGGHPVTLIDTAGLEEAAPASIAGRMRAQSEAAIAKADLVVFVLDTRAGVVPADAAFAQVVRESGRPVVLVANKSEGRAGADGFYEAFRLGLGEPVAISAEHGEGIGELEETLLAALGLKPAVAKRGEDEADAVPDAGARPIRVAIVGRPNSGKSTLVNALLGEERRSRAGRGSPAIRGYRLPVGRPAGALFDTAGLRRKARIVEAAEKLSASDSVRAIRFAEVVVVLLDAQQPLEHQDLPIADMVETEGRAMVVAVNKWDLVADKQRTLKDLRETLKERLAQVSGVPLVTLSALSGRGLDRLEAAVFQAYARWNRRVPTPDLNRWLKEATDRHTPPAVSGRRVKLRYMTQPSARPPTFVVFCTRPEALPKAYLRYLTNSLREAFDLPASPSASSCARATTRTTGVDPLSPLAGEG
jgi:GTP-binding protein